MKQFYLILKYLLWRCYIYQIYISLKFSLLKALKLFVESMNYYSDLFIKPEKKQQDQFKVIQKLYKQNALQVKTSLDQVNKYNHFFEDKKLDSEKQIQIMHLKLRENGFFIKQKRLNEKIKQQNNDDKQQKDNFTVNFNQKCPNWEIVQLDCKLGIYQKKFTVYNINQQSQIHKHKPFSAGSMGQIYNLQSKEENQYDKLIIKCINIEENNNQMLVLMTIKQYFITTMMSILQIGPKIKQYSGFDLIMNKSCLQFSLEKCQQLKYIQHNQEMIQQLKISLKKMHLLKIIHLDIKPQNIMFSKQLNKIVFIDFGISDKVQEQLGFKSFTLFKGTVTYCSKQMFGCLNQKNLVDLYQNDVHCLQLSLKQIKFKNKNIMTQSNNPKIMKQQLILDQPDHSIIKNKRLLLLLKFCLFKSKFKQFHKLFNLAKNQTQNIQYVQAQLLLFFMNIPTSQYIWQFCHRNFSIASKSSGQYTEFIQSYNLNKKYNILSLITKDRQQKLKRSQQYFQNLYENLIQTTNWMPNSVNQIKARQYLLKEQSQNISIQRYLSILIKYLSFLNNIFHTNLEEKYQVCLMFLTKHKKYIISDKQIQQSFPAIKTIISDTNFLSQKLLTICKSILVLIAIVANKKIKDQYKSVLMLELAKQVALFDLDYSKMFSLFYQQIITNQENLLIKITNDFIFITTIEKLQYLKIKRFSKKQRKNLQTDQLRVYNFPAYFDKSRLNLFNKLKSLQVHKQFKSESVSKFIKIIYELQFLVERCRKISTKERQFITERIKKLQHIIFVQHFNLTYLQLTCLTQILIIMSINFILIESQKSFSYSYQILRRFIKKYKQFFSKTPLKVLNVDSNIIQMAYNMKAYSKLKAQLQIIDNKIHCTQITHTFYTSQRLVLAYLSQDNNMIYFYSNLIFSEQAIDLRNQDFILNAFIIFNNFFLDKIIKPCDISSSMKQWIYQVTDQLSLQVSNIQDDYVLMAQYNFVMRLAQGYYTFYSCFDFSLDLKNTKIFQRLNKIDKNLKINLFRFHYIECLQKYYSFFQCNFLKRFQILMRIFNQYCQGKISQSNLDFQNIVYILFQIITLKKVLAPDIQKFSLTQYLIIYKNFTKQDYASLFMSQFLQQFLFKALVDAQSIDQLVIYLRNLVYHLQNYPSWQNSRIFIDFMEISFFPCPCRHCKRKRQMLKEVTFIICHSIMYKQMSNWNCSYASLILLNSLTLQIDLFYKRKILLFIGKTLKYLNIQTKQYILSQFYNQTAIYYQRNPKKYQQSMKKHFKITSKKYTIHSLLKFHLNKIKQFKDNSDKDYVSLFIKKITRFHNIQNNIKKFNSSNEIKRQCPQIERFRTYQHLFLTKGEKQKVLNDVQSILTRLNQ